MAEKYSSKDLQSWFLDKALNSKPEVARRIIRYNDQRGRDTTMVGRLYFFKYDPKLKATLPLYDKFPMCIPLERYSDGFLGLNLHYLSVGERMALLSRLLEYRSNNKMDESTKLKINYQIIEGTKKLHGLATPCVKRYLFAHVRSRFVEIYPTEYDKAAQLPVEDWFKRG